MSRALTRRMDLLNGLVMPDGRHLGETMQPWQRRVVAGTPERSRARRWWVGAHRGSGKTQLAGATTTVALVDLLRPGRKRSSSPETVTRAES